MSRCRASKQFSLTACCLDLPVAVTAAASALSRRLYLGCFNLSYVAPTPWRQTIASVVLVLSGLAMGCTAYSMVCQTPSLYITARASLTLWHIRLLSYLLETIGPEVVRLQKPAASPSFQPLGASGWHYRQHPANRDFDPYTSTHQVVQGKV